MDDQQPPSAGERISRRKEDHFQLALALSSQSPIGPGWDDVVLVHQSLPEVDFESIDLGLTFLGHQLAAPLLISGMTGGHLLAQTVNARLARAAQHHGLAMGLGSQRAQLIAPELLPTYQAARDAAPDLFLIANIGAPQLIDQGDRTAVTIDQVSGLIDTVRANALAIHLNPIQEIVQPGGDRCAAGIADAIARLCQALPVPVIVKETGGGISREVAIRLLQAGVQAIDVGGLGGTNMARIEAARAQAAGDAALAQLGETFASWGIPTAIAIQEAKVSGLPIVGTGGVRNGLDVAKAIALGATLAGVAQPMLVAAIEGDAELDRVIESFLTELRSACFLTASGSVAALQHARYVLLGRTREWLGSLP